jgi:hypothetical protein
MICLPRAPAHFCGGTLIQEICQVNPFLFLFDLKRKFKSLLWYQTHQFLITHRYLMNKQE